MPGFFVLGVFGILAVGGEEDVGLVVGGGEGEDVEDVGGDYVGGEEVDLVGGVGDAVVVEVAFVGVAAVVAGWPFAIAAAPMGNCRTFPTADWRSRSSGR